MSRPSRVPWPAVVALVPFIVLLVVPATRWVVRAYLARLSGPSPALMDLMMDLGVKELPGFGPPPRAEPSVIAAIGASARRNPDDPGAEVVMERRSAPPQPGASSPSQEATTATRLAARFPARPEIWADALIRSSMRLNLGRDLEESYPSKPPSPASYMPAWSRQDLASLELMAEDGEKVDPGNGFFPYMRALALFGLKRDADALAAIHRAASCRRWDDYATFATEAEMRVRREALGRQEAEADFALLYAALYPHFAQMRAGARVAMYDAYVAEQRGDVAKGLAIRHDLIAYADLMRASSRTSIGALVAVAIASMATGWPRGIVPAGTRNLASAAKAARREQAFLAFAGEHAGDRERTWIAGRLAAAREARTILENATPRSFAVGPDLLALGGTWSLGIAVLSIALWCLAMGAVTFQFQPGQRTTWEAPAIVVAGLTGIGWLTWATHASARLSVALVSVVSALTGGSGDSLSQPPGSLWPGAMIFLAPLLVPAVTILVSCICALAGALSRCGALRGMGIGLVWTGLAFSLLFSWTAVSTAQREDRAQVAVRRTLQNEPRYMAELVGCPWPGP